MGIYVFSTDALIEAIESHPDIDDLDFGFHLIPEMIEKKNVFAYEFYDYWQDVGTYDSYLESNLELTGDSALDLYDPKWKIYTKSEDLPPVKVGRHASIQTSLISNGCIINGEVIHSVLSPGVVVGKNTTIRDSVILNDVIIGDNCKIEKTIIDKNTVVGDYSIIGTGKDFTPNKDNPKLLSSGLNVIGKKLILPEGLIVERNVRIFSSATPKEITVKHITSGDSIGTPKL
jgi:glucose-1-phosphate adenylyltransferase